VALQQHKGEIMQNLEDLVNASLSGRLVRAKEISYRLGVSVPTIYHWEKSNDFPKRLRLGPNLVAWKGDDIQAWLDKLEVEGSSQQIEPLSQQSEKI
jgi:predicted DNA-binding transcriptional regulator AlpA